MENKVEFQIGDRVKVVKKVEKEAGWENTWYAKNMDKYIGNIYTIQRIDVSGVRFGEDAQSYGFPSTSLELVKRAHIHAESMKLYAEDAMTTDEPWELWEFSPDGIEWDNLMDNPIWLIGVKYRRKVKTININGFEVPEPVRKPLEIGTKYYTLNHLSSYVSTHMWGNDEIDLRWLKLGLIHLTEANAELHRQALLSFTEIKDN